LHMTNSCFSSALRSHVSATSFRDAASCNTVTDEVTRNIALE
jgi:hypothetical protein